MTTPTRFRLTLAVTPSALPGEEDVPAGQRAILRLRRALKYLSRACGLRATHVEELHEDDPPEEAQP